MIKLHLDQFIFVAATFKGFYQWKQALLLYVFYYNCSGELTYWIKYYFIMLLIYIFPFIRLKKYIGMLEYPLSIIRGKL